MVLRMETSDIGMKITRAQIQYFSYVDEASVNAEREYYGRGRRVPIGFTWYVSRAERQHERLQSDRPGEQ